MSSQFNNIIRQMLIQVFRPLVRIMLRLNVPFNEVSDVLKWTYVDVANKHFGINGKKPTKSRTSVITGLARAQVDKQMKLDLFKAENSQYNWNRAVRVLTGWIEDEAYLDQYDKPKIIAIESSDGPDFKTLVERYSGGTTYRSILDDLLQSDSVTVKDGMVELIKPFYLTVNDPDDVQKINFLGVSTQYLIETIDHNIDPDRPNPRFQRIVFHEHLPKSLINIAESYIREKSQKLANDVDEYLEHLIQHSNHSENETFIPYLGLGLYFYKAGEE